MKKVLKEIGKDLLSLIPAVCLCGVLVNILVILKDKGLLDLPGFRLLLAMTIILSVFKLALSMCLVEWIIDKSHEVAKLKRDVRNLQRELGDAEERLSGKICQIQDNIDTNNGYRTTYRT